MTDQQTSGLRPAIGHDHFELWEMATAEQIKALLESHTAGDDDRFFAIMIQLAAHAARQGHSQLALELRDLVDDAKAKRTLPRARVSRSPVAVAKPRGELADLLSVSYPRARLSDLVLSAEVRSRLEQIVLEHRQREKLAAQNLEPRRKILLVGPPGTGKTFGARALAGELRLPLFTILLEGVITKYMGETAARLRRVFDAAQETRGVYLFDEFDALGGERANTNDVGEARRTLNSLLQFIEQDESQSVLIAATNHVGLLDRALFRRFDDIIHLGLPTPDLASVAIKGRLAIVRSKVRLDMAAVTAAAHGLSYADIVRACDDAAKEAVLGERALTSEMLERALVRRREHTSR